MTWKASPRQALSLTVYGETRSPNIERQRGGRGDTGEGGVGEKEGKGQGREVGGDQNTGTQVMGSKIFPKPLGLEV